MRPVFRILLLASLTWCSIAGRGQCQTPAESEAALVPVVWLEPAAGPPAEKDARPLYKIIPPDDPRARDGERLLDNEPARFTRRLVWWAWRSFGAPSDWQERRLPIVLQPAGNYARSGFRLLVDGVAKDHPDVPYIILELDARSLSDTLLHEGGHVLHSIACRGRRPAAEWSAILHTTFAVTDPLTALAEGYAIHFETLLGHYAREAALRDYYHRVSPAFDLTKSRRAEFYAPVADLLTFSQSWARYQAVRDTWPAFAGHVYPGDYLRSQFDPARDRATLRPANAMIASEGVAASVLFWTSVSLAEMAGAKFGEGLEQPGIVSAEQVLLRGLATLPGRNGFRPDLIDLVGAVGATGSPERRTAVTRFVAVTRGITARPDIRSTWANLYRDALRLDVEGTKGPFAALDASREEIVKEALTDASVLRRGVGAIVPVSAPGVLLTLKVFGEPFPLQFDLNAATEAEWQAAGVGSAVAGRLLAERDRAPFASVADFEKRSGTTLQALGLKPAL